MTTPRTGGAARWPWGGKRVRDELNRELSKALQRLEAIKIDLNTIRTSARRDPATTIEAATTSLIEIGELVSQVRSMQLALAMLTVEPEGTGTANGDDEDAEIPIPVSGRTRP